MSPFTCKTSTVCAQRRDSTTVVVIPMFNNTITIRYLVSLRPRRAWIDSAEIDTRLHAMYGVLNLFWIYSRVSCLSFAVFLSASFSLAPCWYTNFPSIERLSSAETRTPARASSSQFVGGDARRLPPRPPLPIHHTERTPDGGITTATILYQNKLPPAARRALTTSQWFLV